MAAENDAAGKKGVLIWQQPKIEHQRNFMLRLMQTSIPLVIVCMRAKYPMQQVKGAWARSTVLEPKQADDILFEMFVHGWIDQDHKLHVTKYTLPDLASVIDRQRAGEHRVRPTSRRLGQRRHTLSAPRRRGAGRPCLTPPNRNTRYRGGHSFSRGHGAAKAAQRGKEVFDAYYKSQSRENQTKLRAMKSELEALFPREEAQTTGMQGTAR